MTKDTHEYATDLAGVYRDWLHSRHLLQQTIETLSNLKPAQVEVVLENAVMHRLLHSVGPKVPELFAEVDREALAHGFEAIEHAATDKDYDAILAIIGQAWPTEPPTEVPNPRLTDEALVVGAFTQPLVTPVKRLIEEAMSHYEESVALDYVARCALRYASIYAKPRHIGPPQGVYDDFYAWGVRNEGFASPFNARLLGSESGKFFSAFKDTDGVFGSQGSLFQADRRDHPGAWCLDPPFLPKTMQRTVNTIRKWRAEENCPPVLLIVPSSFQPDYEPEETVHLKAGHHCYTGLDGVLSPLPVDVSIHRYGEMEGFSATKIQEGYLP